ncbi:N-acetyl-gamma-glutamyl-phosphate reductase [Brevibacterium sp. 5221]|uniref:N-acetyl-gamma-glutamyl-phosphate reductase n=1 Tax=Brevibacterium rongguiense TaxID=2695267 RepID=A0A6N9H5S3_9MICO|nr:N-acetyl-gamma-glutamyl-phosphate reductase [Brevibacterium rongguiense]MYM19457.1 N-acetyl-gamma-glutamyl-phosphate reductase [Brevibacterium rongguiense]
MSGFTVAVSGATGYAGSEVLRLLAHHPELHVTAVLGHASAGSTMGEHQPRLGAFADMVIGESTAQSLAGHDVAVLALPHGASGRIAAELEATSPQTLIVDLAADHRLVSAQAWERFYGSAHPGTWTYGLPELMTAQGRQRERLAAARRIAVPGCNVTAVTLGLQPLIAAGLIDEAHLTVVLANGVSGAGKAPKPHLMAAEVLGGASPYGTAGTHRHVPEIIQNLNAVLGRPADDSGVRISFTPTLVPMARGILATITAPLAGAALDDHGAVRAALAAAYANEPFVRVLPEGQWPHTGATVGSNEAQLQAAVDPAAGTALISVALDNLVRGTAGQALQSAHLALGLPEDLSLPTEGVAP